MAEVNGVDEAMRRTIFAELCTKELLELEEKSPRIFGSWHEIAKILKAVGADAKTLATVEARRIEALERHNVICERHDGEPPPVELAGWVNQAQRTR